MSTASRSLRAFVAHQPDVADRTSAVSPGRPLTLSESAWRLLSSFRAIVSREASQPEILCTVYGLVLQLSQRDTPNPYEVRLRPADSTTAADSSEELEQHYRIFPDWGTSFFWKDLKHAKTPGGDSTIDDEDIESRYLRLAPYFFAWREIYEEAFEAQELHLGNKAEVFPDVEVRVAWYTEGFLMACWLGLQSGVGSVEFSPANKTYRLDKASVDEKLNEFLNEMDAMLGDTR